MKRRPVARQNHAGDAGVGAGGRLVVESRRPRRCSADSNLRGARMKEAQAAECRRVRVCAAIAVMPSTSRRAPCPSSYTIIDTSWPRSRQARASSTCWIGFAADVLADCRRPTACRTNRGRRCRCGARVMSVPAATVQPYGSRRIDGRRTRHRLTHGQRNLAVAGLRCTQQHEAHHDARVHPEVDTRARAGRRRTRRWPRRRRRARTR